MKNFFGAISGLLCAALGRSQRFRRLVRRADHAAGVYADRIVGPATYKKLMGA